MKRQNSHETSRVGDLLLASGTITRDQLLEAVARQRDRGDACLLGEVLVELGYATAEDVELALLRQRARRGQMDPADGLRLFERAEESTRRAGLCIDDLALAAAELGRNAK